MFIIIYGKICNYFLDDSDVNYKEVGIYIYNKESLLCVGVELGKW